jgi:glycosyltransferase involved in cell wall biosynthesis
MKLYGTLAGFRYYIKAKPLLGAYVAMENYNKGLLKHGKFCEYHTYYNRQQLRSLSKDEIIRAYFRHDKLKVVKLENLVNTPDICYQVLHFESIMPYKEVIFRNMFSKKNIPVTRRVYTVSTNAHLRELLNIQLLGCGGRPYDSIVVPSKATQLALLSYFEDLSTVTNGTWDYRGRVDVIPYGIHVEDFQPDDKFAARKFLDLPLDSIVILSVARISQVSKMNYYQLLEFFSRLSDQCNDTDIVLLIAGAAADNEIHNLRKIAEDLHVMDNVKIIPNFEDDIKKLIFNSADIFISLSDNLQESFGIALIEAMAIGLPVICTDWDGYKDIVDDAINGYRIPTKWKVKKCADDILVNFKNPYDHSVIYRISQNIQVDMDLLIKRAKNLIYNENLRRVIGQKGRKKVLREYSSAAEISQFEALWDELAGIAEKDRNDYRDLSSVLYYDYPRHFKSYPSILING